MKPLLLLILLSLFVRAQSDDLLRFRGNIESGVYSPDPEQTQWLTSLSASLSYRKSFEGSILRFKGRIVPKYYSSSQIRTVKLSSNITYLKEVGPGNLNMTLLIRNNDYGGGRITSFNYKIVQAGGLYTHQLSDKYAASYHFDYYYRKFSKNYFNQLTGISGRLRIQRKIMDQLKLGVGVYGERFTITDESDQDVIEKNIGFRYGPEIRLDMRSRYILSVTGLYCRQEYDRFADVDNNYHILMVFGRYLSRHVTSFLFINMYKSTRPEQVPVNLSYKPISNENYVLLKIGYDLNKRSELYLKVGYQSDEFFDQNEHFSGRLLLFGYAINR